MNGEMNQLYLIQNLCVCIVRVLMYEIHTYRAYYHILRRIILA